MRGRIECKRKHLEMHFSSKLQWLTHALSALKRQRQEDHQSLRSGLPRESQVSLGYRIKPVSSLIPPEKNSVFSEQRKQNENTVLKELQCLCGAEPSLLSCLLFVMGMLGVWQVRAGSTLIGSRDSASMVICNHHAGAQELYSQKLLFLRNFLFEFSF